jgi:amicoumacin kinase
MEEKIAALLRPEYVVDAARQWHATGDSLLLDEVSNFVYEIRSQNEPRILRLTHSSHHTEAEIVAELDWLKFLIQNGVSANRPLLSRNGRLTECYPVEGSYFVAAAFEYAPGHLIDSSMPQEWNPQFFQTLGRIMGRMHRLTKSYRPSSLSAGRPHWDGADLLRQAERYLPADQRPLVAVLEPLLARFRHQTPTVDSYGLVHNDVNPTNYNVKDGHITLFDFDDCAYNWFINDIAVAMPMYSQLFADAGWEAGLTEFFQRFMLGYQEENHLDEFWLEVLPDCLRLQNMLTLISCYQSNVPNSQYHSFYELVLKICRQGHPIFAFDFRKAYESLA